MNIPNDFLKNKLWKSIFIFVIFWSHGLQTYCQQKDFKEARIYITAEATHQLLDDCGFTAFEPLEQPDENYPTIMLDDDKTFQAIEGFGGAFTDASAITYRKTSKRITG